MNVGSLTTVLAQWFFIQLHFMTVGTWPHSNIDYKALPCLPYWKWGWNCWWYTRRQDVDEQLSGHSKISSLGKVGSAKPQFLGKLPTPVCFCCRPWWRGWHLEKLVLPPSLWNKPRSRMFLKLALYRCKLHMDWCSETTMRILLLNLEEGNKE